jgi:hypothetical protein
VRRAWQVDDQVKRQHAAALVVGSCRCETLVHFSHQAREPKESCKQLFIADSIRVEQSKAGGNASCRPVHLRAHAAAAATGTPRNEPDNFHVLRTIRAMASRSARSCQSRHASQWQLRSPERIVVSVGRRLLESSVGLGEGACWGDAFSLPGAARTRKEKALGPCELRALLLDAPSRPYTRHGRRRITGRRPTLRSDNASYARALDRAYNLTSLLATRSESLPITSRRVTTATPIPRYWTSCMAG